MPLTVMSKPIKLSIQLLKVQNFGDLGTVTPRNVDVVRDSPSNLTAESGNNIGNYLTLNPLRNGQHYLMET